MKLHICGNGFDLHHGFKTDFQKYKEFLSTHYPWDSHYTNIVASFENSPYLFLEKSNRWADVEKSLTVAWEQYADDYVSAYHPTNRVDPNSPTYEKEMGILCEKNLKCNRDFFREIYDFTGICYYEWLTSVDLSEGKADLFFNANDIFLNFNYTTTLETLYKIPSNQILHIHGCLKDINRDDLYAYTELSRGEIITEVRSGIVKSELQFGSIYNNPKSIETALITKYSNDVCNESFYKQMIDDFVTYLNWSYKCIDNNYEKVNLFLKDKSVDEVVIMGHSLLEVDDLYYEKILVPKFRECKWTIYWFNEKAKNQAKEFSEKYKLDAKLKQW